MKEYHVETQEVEEEELLSDSTTVDSVTEQTVFEEQDESANKSEQKFVSRVTSIPLVQDSVSTAQAIANKSSLGRFALSTANSTFATLSKYTSSSQPKYVQNYYDSYIQPHIEKADALGCHSLDLIQAKFPVFTQPTSDIVKAVTEPSYQIVDGVKVQIDNTITQPASHVAKQVNTRFGYVVDNFEAAIDRYLPASAASKNKQDNDDNNQAVRAYNLLNNVTLCLSQKVSDQIKATATYYTLQSQDSPSRGSIVEIISALVQKATINIQSLQETLVQSITLYGQAAHQRFISPAVTALHAVTAERLSALTAQVSVQLQQVIDFIKIQSSEAAGATAPEWLKNRITSLVEIANKQVDLVRVEYNRSDINSSDKVKNVAQTLQGKVLPVLHNVQAQLSYYSSDLKMPLEHLGLLHTSKSTVA